MCKYTLFASSGYDTCSKSSHHMMAIPWLNLSWAEYTVPAGTRGCFSEVLSRPHCGKACIPAHIVYGTPKLRCHASTCCLGVQPVSGRCRFIDRCTALLFRVSGIQPLRVVPVCHDKWRTGWVLSGWLLRWGCHGYLGCWVSQVALSPDSVWSVTCQVTDQRTSVKS